MCASLDGLLELAKSAGDFSPSGSEPDTAGMSEGWYVAVDPDAAGVRDGRGFYMRHSRC